MLRDLARGLLAGAAGTVALNITTYGDMAVRGRSASHVPGEDVNVLLHEMGIELPGEEREREAVGHAHRAQLGRQGQGHHEQHQHSVSREHLLQGYANPREWPHSKTARNRLTALGALVGYGVGLSTGVAYALTRTRLGKLPLPLAGVAVGLAAMAGSDVPSVALGVTNPKTWGWSGWIEDIIPHLIYGMVTVGVYETLVRAEQSARRGWWPW